MSDFDDLRQIREAKERAEASALQKALEEERRKAEAVQRLEDRQRANARKLNDTVIEVMEALKDAVYPDDEVHNLSGTGHSDRWNNHRRSATWELGYQSSEEFRAAWGILQRRYDSETGDYYSGVVFVALEFGKSGDPLRFVCRLGGSKPVTCGPTRDELIRTLKSLYLSHTG